LLDREHFAVVSDRSKKRSQPKRCQDKDQSIHIFKLSKAAH